MRSLLRIAIAAVLYYILFAFAASLLQAQELPDAPKPKPSKVEEIAWDSALAATTAWDLWESHYAQKRGSWEQPGINSSEWFIGRRPNDHKYILFNAAQLAVQFTIVHYGLRSKHKTLRIAARTVAAFNVANHIGGAINSRDACRPAEFCLQRYPKR